MGFSLKKVFKPVAKLTNSKWGRALAIAGLAAATVFTGGAAAGALGLVEGGALAGGAGALLSTGGAIAAGSGAMAGYQEGVQKEAQKQQLAAQQEAQDKADAAVRQQEYIRKRAMIAEQDSLSARDNIARNVRNNLRGLSSSRLGGTTEQLGG